jgi:hypothetical protein
VVVGDRTSYIGEKLSGTIVESEEIGQLIVRPRSGWKRHCACVGFGMDEAHGFFECSLVGTSDRVGRS